MSRLQDACRKNGPLCIGLDTDPSYLPESVIAKYPSKEEAVLAYNEFVRKFTSPDAYEIVGDGDLVLTEELIECISQTRGRHDRTTGTYVPSPELREYLAEKRNIYKFL